MPIIEQEIFDKLSADAGVTAIVSDRIFPLPGDLDAVKPYITFQRISTTPSRGLDGNLNFARYRFQVASVGTTYLESKELANAVRNALDSTSTSTMMANELDQVDEDAGLYTIQDFLIFRGLDT